MSFSGGNLFVETLMEDCFGAIIPPMKKFRSFSLTLIVYFVSLGPFNLKAMADGEILRFDEKTKTMLQRAVTEMEKDYPGSDEYSNRFIAHTQHKKGLIGTQLLLTRVQCVLVDNPERVRSSHCEASRYLLVLENGKAILSTGNRAIVDSAVELIQEEFGLEDEDTDSSSKPSKKDTFLPALGYV
jgi:hypothetical protein